MRAFVLSDTRHNSLIKVLYAITNTEPQRLIVAVWIDPTVIMNHAKLR
jgi:hypothetical protein